MQVQHRSAAKGRHYAEVTRRRCSWHCGTRSHKATYTVDEAAEILGVSRNSAYQAVHAGELPAVKIGKRLLVPRIAFEKMLDSAGQKLSGEKPA